MLKRLFTFGYRPTTSLISFQDLINTCSVDLFQCMKRSNRCLHHVLARCESRSDRLRPRGHNYILTTRLEFNCQVYPILLRLGGATLWIN